MANRILGLKVLVALVESLQTCDILRACFSLTEHFNFIFFSFLYYCVCKGLMHSFSGKWFFQRILESDPSLGFFFLHWGDFEGLVSVFLATFVWLADLFSSLCVGHLSPASFPKPFRFLLLRLSVSFNPTSDISWYSSLGRRWESQVSVVVIPWSDFEVFLVKDINRLESGLKCNCSLLSISVCQEEH